MSEEDQELVRETSESEQDAEGAYDLKEKKVVRKAVVLNELVKKFKV